MNYKFLTSVAACGLVAACGGSGGSDNGIAPGTVITGSNALNIGTTSTTQTSNGLPFATEEDIDIFEEVQEGTVRLVRLSQETGDLLPEFLVTAENISYDPKDLDDDDDDEFTITISGTPVLFTLVEVDDDGDAFDALRGTSGGRTYQLSFVRGEDYSVVINIFEVNSQRLFESFAVVGLQTNPNALPASGIVSYSDFFEAYGEYIINGRSSFAELDVTVEIDVNFDNGGVSGKLFADIQNFEDGYANGFDLELDPTTLVGTGFQTAMTTCTFAQNCTSNSTIGGALFGPNAEELGGVVMLDVTADFTPLAPDSTEPDLTTSVRAVGGYIGTQPLP